MVRDFRIRKVKFLRGKAKELAEKNEWKPNDLVIVIGPDYIEKIEGDPVSFLLKRAKGTKPELPLPYGHRTHWHKGRKIETTIFLDKDIEEFKKKLKDWIGD